MKEPLKVIELFAGIGAPRKALMRGGGTTSKLLML